MVRSILAIFQTVLLSSCSLLLMDKPLDDFKPSATPQCDRSKTTVGVDAAIAVINTIAMGRFLANRQGGPSPDDVYTSRAVASGIDAVFFAVSAVIGNGWADACRDQYEAHDRWMVERTSPKDEVPIASLMEGPVPVLFVEEVEIGESGSGSTYTASRGDSGVTITINAGARITTIQFTAASAAPRFTESHDVAIQIDDRASPLRSKWLGSSADNIFHETVSTGLSTKRFKALIDDAASVQIVLGHVRADFEGSALVKLKEFAAMIPGGKH